MGSKDPDGRWGQMGSGCRWGVISKHPLGTVWHETTLMSHQSEIIYFLILFIVALRLFRLLVIIILSGLLSGKTE